MGDGERSRLARGEFPALWVAEGLSVLGDQLAKVAVALLVFHRTGSAALTALSYGLTFLPPLLTGPALSGLADRYPRRALMMTCCLLQAGCVAVMAAPRLPLAALVAGAMVVAGIQTPFKAAQGALVLDVLGPQLNKAGRARLVLVREVGQLAGLAGAAAVVTAVGTSGALLIDTATFLLAAGLIAIRVRHRGATRSAADRSGLGWGAVVRLALRDSGMRTLVVLIAVIGLTAAPDAVIVPLVAEAGAPTWVVGPLLAADCLGLVLGAWWVERRPVHQQRVLVGPLALISMVPLAAFVLRPDPLVAGVLLVVSGAGSAYLPLAIGELTERVQPEVTGTTNGLINVVLRVSQGLAAITAGVLAQAISAAMAVSLLGACGVLLTSVYAVRWRQAQFNEV